MAIFSKIIEAKYTDICIFNYGYAFVLFTKHRARSQNTEHIMTTNGISGHFSSDIMSIEFASKKLALFV